MNQNYKDCCKDCRFYNINKCLKFNINVSEEYKKCNDFAEKTPMNESISKMKLYD